MHERLRVATHKESFESVDVRVATHQEYCDLFMFTIYMYTLSSSIFYIFFFYFFQFSQTVLLRFKLQGKYLRENGKRFRAACRWTFDGIGRLAPMCASEINL